MLRVSFYKYGESSRERERQTDRQRQRETDRQTDREKIRIWRILIDVSVSEAFCEMLKLTVLENCNV